MASPVAQERLSYISALYKQQDAERDKIDAQLALLGIETDDKTQLPFERVYFNGDMLGKYEPCMDALQSVIDADGEDDDAWKVFEQLFGKFMDFSWCSNWDGKRYDMVIYGCSGYTGYLSMEYLKRVGIKRTPENFTFAFAGRTASKVTEMRDREFKGTEWEDTKVLQASYDDPVSMIDLARSARVIYNVAGPYLLTPGEIMLDACCFAGTHYVDINGEIPWMYRTFELHERAKDCNSLICPAAAAAGGVPDILISLCANQIRTDYGEELTNGCCYWFGGGEGGGSSGGTLATRNAMSAGTDEDRKLMANPFALDGFIPARDKNGLKEVTIKAGTGECTMKLRKEDNDAILSKLKHDPLNNCYGAPHTYAYFDTRIVRRTNALLASYLGTPYGRNFNFQEFFLVPGEGFGTGEGFSDYVAPTAEETKENEEKEARNVAKREASNVLAGGDDGVRSGMTAAEEKAALEKAGKYFKQGEGPPLEDLDEVWMSWMCQVESTSGHIQKNAAMGKDGYFETARTAIETGLTLVFDYDKLPIKGGCCTPAACASQAVSARLINSGLKFKQGKWFAPWEWGPPKLL